MSISSTVKTVSSGGSGSSGSFPLVFGGRLTLTSGTPITTTDVTAAGTLYYTPATSDRTPKYDGSNWTLPTFSEASLALVLTSGKQYSIFWNGTNLFLSAAWATDNTPTDAIGTQNGVPCLSSDHTKLLVGTIRASGANITEDSDAHRFVHNIYNQAIRRLHRYEISTIHNYAVATWREWNGGTGGPHRVQFVTSDVQVFDSSGWSEISGDGTNTAYVSYSLNSASLEGLAVGSSTVNSFSRTGLSASYVSAVGFNDLIVTELSGAGISVGFNYYRIMAEILG